MNEAISEIQWLDKGKNYQANDTLTVPDGFGNMTGKQVKINNVLANQTVTLTQASFNTTYRDRTHPPGTPPNSLYAFDAGGDPNGLPKLTYSAGDVMLDNRQTGNAENPGWETYTLREIDTQTYNGETTLKDEVFQNYTANTQSVPKNWTRFLGRVDFGNPFTIYQYPTGTNQAGELTGNVNVENPAPTVDTSGRVQYSVPTPTDAQMAQVAFAGTVNDNAAAGNVSNGMSVTLAVGS